MKLSKFYNMLSCNAKIHLVREGVTVYAGLVRDTPDEFDDLEVLDFICRETGIVGHYEFIFYVK